jgi:hypothetical protein
MKSLKDIMTIFFKVRWSLVLFALCSCQNEFEDEIDFRDDYIGIYNCLGTYYYFSPINDTVMNWSVDTIALNQTIEVEKDADSSLNIIIGNYSFLATYDDYWNHFTCLECNGPPNYAEFYSDDSIYIFIKSGVTNSFNYKGRKMTD